MMVRKYFKIEGYWEDSKEEFSDLIVTNYDDHELDEDGNEIDIDVFEYGWSEENLKQSLNTPDVTGFVITNYEEI